MSISKKTPEIHSEEEDISYIEIDKDSFKDNFVPTENEISNYFNENKKIYTIPEKRSFKQFNFKSKEKAEDFKIKIAGMSNEDIISYASNNNIKFNNFKDLDSNQVLDELSNSIFFLNNNEVSKVITTTFTSIIF